MKKILIFIFFITFLSCKTEIKKVISRYENKQDKIVFYFENKKDTLTYRKEVFYKSGKKNYVGYISNGKKDGMWIWWYENGVKKDQCKFEGGFYVDTVFHWYENGNIRQLEIVGKEKIRTDGCCVCNGTIIRYYENGKIKEKFTSIDDKFQGQYTFYEENGSWFMRTLKDDIKHGPTIEYIIDSVKTQKITGQYENDKESGLWKWYDGKGKLTDSVLYKNGIVQ
ncbi:MAG: hypothetical protein IPP60_00480 [Sphingobacteriales bacterium]|nr:hypothetical protein [Sphingobacteriales bacterium]